MTIERALAAPRVVLKVGSALLVDPSGELRTDWLAGLALDLEVLLGRRQNVIVVSSGAIALGWRSIGLPRRPSRLEEKQAAAAAGQILLARAWAEALQTVGRQAAQILLTLEDTENRRRYLNARATFATLLRIGVVPVVNENDTVATAEIRFGDNDRLSARVAVMTSADTLILLSDVDGLYTADPTQDPAARHLPRVERVTDEIMAMAGASQSGLGTGGMVSKLEAARIANGAGCTVVLTRGTVPRPLAALPGERRCTIFEAGTTPRRARKDWIAGTLGVTGGVVVDAGALQALRRGSSLLPAGVVSVDGGFERGDAVLIRDAGGAPVAKGLSAYDAADARRIAGRRTAEIEAILGFRGRDVLVHRDDLVLL